MEMMFARVVLNRRCVITAWSAPGSNTVNSRIKWGDGTYSPVVVDKCSKLTPYYWIWEKFGFKHRTYATFKFTHHSV